MAGVSAAVAAAALCAGAFVRFPPLSLLGALFLFGSAAGALATRQAWLSGIIVGLPLALQQIARSAAREPGGLGAVLASADFWVLGVPVAVVVTGVAILGGIAGARYLGPRFQRAR